MKKFTLTKNRLITYICCLILPFLAIASGFKLLSDASLLTYSFVFTHIIIPISGIIGLSLSVFYNTKILRKVIVSAIILIISSSLFFIGFIFGEYGKIYHFENEELKIEYSKKAEKNELMPSLDEIGTAIDTDYYNIYLQYFIYFTPETDYLVCEYTTEDYEKQKNFIEKEYIFQKKQLSNYDASCESVTEIDGFSFKALSIDEKSYAENIDYPKKMMIIAFSDKTNEIIYMTFHDDDIDYISSFNEFINDDCGWKYIRKRILEN